MARENNISDPSIAIMVDPQTNKSLGGLRLMGETMPASEWIHASGDLQGFEIIGDRWDLWKVWVEQKEILMRTESGQRLVKIMTYPAEGENQGYLDFVGAFEHFPEKSRARISTLKGLAFLQSLLGT